MADGANPLGMSDEDFLKQGVPEVVENTENKDDVTDDQSGTKVEDKPVKTEVTTEDKSKEDEADKDKAPEKDDAAKDDNKVEDKSDTKEVADKDKTDDKAGDNVEGKADDKAEKPTEKKPDEKTDEKPVDKGVLYDQIMAPFKANGKTIELRSPEEAIKLMQMGANYTRKLQELSPHRRIISTLQANNIDEAKLSYLIDLDKNNPDAIKKLIKDSGIDPLDIDTDKSPDYKPVNHSVSDEEVQFRTVLEELSSEAAGKETLNLINTQWDEQSKEILWSQPQVMTAIHEQRENGVYTKIAAEVDRRKTLGVIPQSTPFLQAYTDIGNEIAAAAARTTEDKRSEPIETRAATPKSTVKDDDKASSAAVTKTASTGVKTVSNPLAQSDEEFLKSMNNRL